MNISRFEVNPFGEVTYILWDETSRQACIVDPGMMRDDERDMIENFLASHHLTLQFVLLSHIHIDHVTSAQWMADRHHVKIYASPDDAFLASTLQFQAQMFNLKIALPNLKTEPLTDGDEITLAGEKIQVIATPGHTPGCLSFYLPESGILVSGDTLFEGSVGRTDLPGGNFDQLITGIKERLLTLPGETIVAPGHGHTTTIENERLYNPFLA